MTRRHLHKYSVAAAQEEEEEKVLAAAKTKAPQRQYAAKRRKKRRRTLCWGKGVLMLPATTTATIAHLFSSLLLLHTAVATAYYRSTPSPTLHSSSNDESLVMLPESHAPHPPQGQASDRIIGGVNAEVDRYPYAATLWDFQQQRCAGALVASDIILTAAHCRNQYTRVDLNRYNIVLPPNSLFEDTERYVLDKVVNHPLSRKDDIRSPQRYDFSLIKLWGRSTSVRPVAIAGIGNQVVNYTDGQPLTVIGWGYTTSESSPPQQRSNVLREVELYYVNNQECSRANITGAASNYTFQGRIFPEMMCAAAPGRDSCNGDSGGPILIPREQRLEQASVQQNDKDDNNNNNTNNNSSSLVPLNVDVLVGSVSFGAQCASEVFPGVYSRVSEAADWIREAVCNLTSYEAPSWFQCTNPPPPLPPPSDQLTLNITIELQLDLDSHQTGWLLRSVATGTVYGYKPILSYRDNAGEFLLYETVQLPPPSENGGDEYEFVLLDAGGDGVCCDWADGYFKIYQGTVTDPPSALRAPVLVNETRGEWPRFPIGDLDEELYTTHVSVVFSPLLETREPTRIPTLPPTVSPTTAPTASSPTVSPTTSPVTAFPTSTPPSKSPAVVSLEVPTLSPSMLLSMRVHPTKSPSPTVWFPTGSTPPTVSVTPGPKTGGGTKNGTTCLDRDTVTFRIYVPNHRHKKRNCAWLSQRNPKKVAYYCDTIRKARGFCRATCGFACNEDHKKRRYCTDLSIRGAVFPWHVRTNGTCEWLRQQRPTKRAKYCAQKKEYFSNAFHIPAKVCPHTCKVCPATAGSPP